MAHTKGKDWIENHLQELAEIFGRGSRWLFGALKSFSLRNYLLLVDYTGGLFREGKATISRELSRIFDRQGSSAESWWARLEKLSRGRPLGRFFAATRERLREVASQLGVGHLANLAGRPAR